MTYKEAQEYIEEKQLFRGIRSVNGLEQLCHYLGNPQQALQVIGMAGVNGRRNVTAYVGTVLSNAGYQVGRYAEAAVTELRGHILLKERPMTKQGFCECLEQIQDAIERMRAERIEEPSAGAIETAAAFLYFQKRDCEVVLWEVAGDYGKMQLEVIPKVIAMVYAPIRADLRLYDTEILEKIAERQAALMREKCPVISAVQLSEVEQVLRARAEVLSAPFSIVEEHAIKKIKYGLEKQSFTYRRWERLEIRIGGKAEIEHAVLAAETLAWMGESGWDIKESALRKGLLQTVMEDQMYIAGRKPWFLVHTVENENAAQVFAKSMEQYFAGKRKIYIIGFLRTMEYDKIARHTLEQADHVITVTVRNHADGMHAYELAGEVQPYHFGVTAVDSPEEAVELAYLLADKESVIAALGATEALGSLIECEKGRSKKVCKV